MSAPPIYEGQPLSDADKRLIALFDELEKKQIDFLDEAGKRIVELTTGLLGVLFAVTAFGDKFPPPYLAGNRPAQWTAVVTLALYIAAMLCGVVTLWPRSYRRYHHNLTRLGEELENITRHKSRWFTFASGLFVLGSLCLALLIGAVIFSA